MCAFFFDVILSLFQQSSLLSNMGVLLDRIRSEPSAVSLIFASRNGSVVANFSVNYTEITRFELITLFTSLQERKVLSSMPISAFEFWSNESK